MNKKVLLAMGATVLISACTVRAGGPDGQGGIAKDGAPTSTPLPPLPTREVAARQSVAADGALALGSPIASVAFETTGKVTAVNVVPGQKVRKGEVLAQLDEQALKDTLAQAQEQLKLTEAQIRNTVAGTAIRDSDVDSARAAVLSAQARYSETLRGASKADYDAARANIVAAQARYSDTLRGASSADLEQARAALDGAKLRLQQARTGGTASEQEQALRSWNAAKNSLYSAQVSRDQSCSRGTDSPTCKTSEASVGQAYENERGSYDRYQQTLKPASEDKIKSAEAEVASAQSRLDTLLKANGTDKVKAAEADLASAQARLTALWLQSSPEKLVISRAEIASAEARLKQLTDPAPQTEEAVNLARVQFNNAQAAVERAERNLAKAKLVAPCDCSVQDVNVAVGSNASGPAMTLLDLKSVVFKTSNLSERDLGAIRPGSAAIVRLKPFDRSFNGKVSTVLPQSSGVQGTTAIFTVLITLDPAQEELLPGMTGQAEIVVK